MQNYREVINKSDHRKSVKKLERFIKRHYKGLTDEECSNTARHTLQLFEDGFMITDLSDQEILSMAVDMAIDELNYNATGPRGLDPEASGWPLGLDDPPPHEYL